MRKALRAAILVTTIPITATAARDADRAHRNGSSAAHSIVFEWRDDLWTLDTCTQRVTNLTATPETQERMPVVSPDGRRVAYVDYGEAYLASEIAVRDLTTGRVRRLTENSVADVEPAWSPDGFRLAWIQDGGDGAELVVADENGSILFRLSPEEHRLTGIASPAWSPSGQSLLFSATSRDRIGDDAYRFDLETHELTPLPEGSRPVSSSDAEQLAYARGLAEGSAGHTKAKAPSAAPKAALLDPRCQVDAVVVEDSFSSWRQFKATLKGDCGFDPTLGTKTSVQYFADGKELGDRMGVHPPDFECKNTSGPVETEGPSVHWYFPTTGGHTIGARVVEWANRPLEGRVCEAFSDIVSRGVNISIPAGDSDADGISNAVENSLIGQFHPTYQLHPDEPAPQSNLESVTVRVGPTLPRVATPIVTRILMNYNVLWFAETGDCWNTHIYDTEPMGYRIEGGSKPYSTTGWSVAKTETIAHDGTWCERIMTRSGYVNPVYVGLGKHGSFLTSDCYDHAVCCNHCSTTGPALVYTPHPVGNGKDYPGNCGHNRHLVNGNFLVPEKWGSLFSSFGLYSPFPP